MTSGLGDLPYRDEAAGVARHISFRRWRADAANLAMKSWPDEESRLVYDERSGHTHVLGPVEAWLLDLLTAETLGIADLAGRLATGLGRAPDAELVKHVEAIVERLEEQSLVERTLL